MERITITPAELEQRRQQGEQVDLIDVRSPGEFNGVHATGARNIPLDRFDAAAVLAERGETDRPLVLLCHAGPRAANAADKLEAVGCQRVELVDGGTKAWSAAGLPVVRGRGTISVERQLQLTVGLLIVIGCALTFWVHPYFVALPAAIGLGLFNAGATGLCPLAMVIAVMPWNKGSASCPLTPKASATSSQS